MLVVKLQLLLVEVDCDFTKKQSTMMSTNNFKLMLIKKHLIALGNEKQFKNWK